MKETRGVTEGAELGRITSLDSDPLSQRYPKIVLHFWGMSSVKAHTDISGRICLVNEPLSLSIMSRLWKCINVVMFWTKQFQNGQRKPEPLYELCWIWDGCLRPPRSSPGRLSVSGHQPKVTLQISPKAPPVSSWAEWQIAVLLLVWCPSTVLPSSQHIMVGLLRRLHTAENTGLRPHILLCHPDGDGAVAPDWVSGTALSYQQRQGQR